MEKRPREPSPHPRGYLLSRQRTSHYEDRPETMQHQTAQFVGNTSSSSGSLSSRQSSTGSSSQHKDEES